ncbi:hypothetical protein C8N46_102493 [Kordia periserrulae]|uniref:Peptidase M20/M25/M40-like protein n=1 Tax=Kordia periserrulae TaxID=701523 RepID=A0A2T6C439_9FLAO|nr:hypothetical protein [Kordia periserrulae]PTX63090.1 hypothetical protein C8N46_102493 [Kordia periserrulae]
MKTQFYFSLLFFFLCGSIITAQTNWDEKIKQELPSILQKHRDLVSIPNVSSDTENMMKNVTWVTEAFAKLGFEVSIL